MGGIEDEDIAGYYLSGHAGGIGPSSPKGNPDCYHCMAAEGFISVTINGEDPPEADDFEEVDGVYYLDGRMVNYGIYCGACHDLHPEDSHDPMYQLRAPEEEICELCHYNTHIFPDTHVRHPTSEFRHGLNGKDVPQIKYMDEVSCPECHMYGTGHRAEVIIVGHSFDWVPQACVDCHSMYTNETALEYVEGVHADFDAMVAMFGDGETTGLRFEVHERMAWAMDNDLWTDDLNMTYLEAEWNYEYPVRDGSMGAHNPGYMEAMFKSAYEKWEEVLASTEWGGVEGTLTWDDGTAIDNATIKDAMGTTVATTDAEGMYFFWADAGAATYIVSTSDGDIGTLTATAETMTNVTKDVTFTKETGGDGDGDGDDEEEEGFDTMHYAFIGIIVLLIIILIVVAMMGKKSE
jgi:hypothetical protein